MPVRYTTGTVRAPEGRLGSEPPKRASESAGMGSEPAGPGCRGCRLDRDMPAPTQPVSPAAGIARYITREIFPLLVTRARSVISRPTNLRLDDQLCFALYAATNTVIRAYRPLLERIGLTYPQYLVMLVLWQDGEHAVHEIASRLALPPHAISPLLARLDGAGLVVRRREAPDHRVVHVHLTAAGAELQAAASQAQRTVVCRTRLGPNAMDDLRAELHDLVRQMDADLGLPSRDRRRRQPEPARHKASAAAGWVEAKTTSEPTQGEAS